MSLLNLGNSFTSTEQGNLFHYKRKCPSILYFISTITPGCVFVLVAAPQRVQFPAAVRAPTAVAKTRIAISEQRPYFEKRILEERRPVTQTHVNADWFVLLDGGLKESGISHLFGFVIFFADELLTRVVALSLLHETLGNICSLFIGYNDFCSTSECEQRCTFGIIQEPLAVLCFAESQHFTSSATWSWQLFCSLTSSAFAFIIGLQQELIHAFALIPLFGYLLLAHLRF